MKLLQTEVDPVQPRIRLDVIEIADPCPADWSAMSPVDGERVKFCRHCQKDVYNLSTMLRQEAERLVADRLAPDTDHPICIRMYKRLDGTVVTSNCAARWRSSVRQFSARWGGRLSAVMGLILAFTGCEDTATQGVLLTGKPAPVTQPIPMMGLLPVTTQPHATTAPTTQGSPTTAR